MWLPEPARPSATAIEATALESPVADDEALAAAGTNAAEMPPPSSRALSVSWPESALTLGSPIRVARWSS